MIHLYIYFKQENAKKNLYFLLLFCGIVLRKTQLVENTLRRNASFRSCAYWEKKEYPRMFLGTILLKKVAIRNAKIFVPALVNLLIRW
jgi:hypothetical protein